MTVLCSGTTVDLKMLLNSLEMSMNLLLCMFLSDVRLSICAAWLAFVASCLAICYVRLLICAVWLEFVATCLAICACNAFSS